MNAVLDQPEKISSLDWYRVFRSRIEHEDGLIVQRLSWLVASQSFLFTAHAIVMNGLTAPAGAGSIASQQTLLVRIIPVVALFNSLLIYVSILAALKAIRELRRFYQAHAAGIDMLPIQTNRTTRLLGLSAPILLPLLFIMVWLLLLVRDAHA
jgi:hypothetical protein